MSNIDVFSLDRLFEQCEESMIVMHLNGQIKKMNQDARKLLKGENLLIDYENTIVWDEFLQNVKKIGSCLCVLDVFIETYAVQLRVFGCYKEKNNEIILLLKRKNDLINWQVKNDMLDYVHSAAFFTDKLGIIINSTSNVDEILKIDISTQQFTYPQLLMRLGCSAEQMVAFFAELQQNSMSSVVLEYEVSGNHHVLELIAIPNAAQNGVMTIVKNRSAMLNQREDIGMPNMMEFIATIVHEIRNPMTSLKGFLELLKCDNAEEKEQYFSIIDAEFERLELMLEDFLYLSKPKKILQTHFSLIEVAQQTIDLMHKQAMQQNIKIELQYNRFGNFTIFGNASRFKQLMINVIKNAIECMGSGGTIKIFFKLTVKNEIEFVIQDQGSGMSEETLANLFAAFFTTKTEGSGLGLPLVKKIIEEHHGSVTVKSELGIGTQFTFVLPSNVDNYSISMPIMPEFVL